VIEGETRCVQEVAAERRKHFPADAFLARCAVDRVADHGRTERGKVDADLVRAAGV